MATLTRPFLVAPALLPANAMGATLTGLRVEMGRALGLTVVVVSTGAMTLSLWQHRGASGGTPLALGELEHAYLRTGTTITGAERWTRQEQALSHEVSHEGSGQALVVAELRATSLADGCTHVSVSVEATAVPTRVAALYLLRDFA